MKTKKENSESSPEPEKVDPEVIQSAIDAASDYLLTDAIGDWAAVALNRAGKEIPEQYLEQVKETLRERNGEFRNITDYERITLGILAAGADPTDIEGYNLVEQIYNGNLTRQGLNGVAFGLIALDSGNFEIPEDAEWDRERIISHLLAEQHENGGWGWNGVDDDIDTTAMVIAALAPYQSQSDVKESIDAALNYIENNTTLIDNSSTAAQVIIALASIGIEANQYEFEKNGESLKLVEYLISYQNEDGGFYWKNGYGSDSDVFSTDQALRGLVAYQLYLQGEEGLYHFSIAEEEVPEEEPKKKEEVDEEEEPEIVNSDTTQSTKEGNGGTIDPSKNKETTTPVETIERTSEGEQLPNTATNSLNLLFGGFVLLLVGVTVILISRKRRIAMK
ncbi:prenyltransferase/squalene oxidase repeat-containing protein [Bacillus sp. JCM 19034]|uniref:prenyltransferase/squalene oxidase repeat-containing protein n=1 Tax=Bacillus sp. JCM 19034 TaxID=1481928 RepID=UPI000783BF8C|nr:prenyltransferase/squalene oxidase repeat-containing protein [Bacillus sp. JCM 19034]